MKKQDRSDRFSEKLCAFEPLIRRALFALVAITVTMISCFGVGAVVTKDPAQTAQTATVQAYRAASKEEKVLLHRELTTRTASDPAVSQDIDALIETTDALGDAVESLYSAVASINQQKTRMSAAAEPTEAPAPVEQTTTCVSRC